MKIHENCPGNQWNDADTNPPIIPRKIRRLDQILPQTPSSKLEKYNKLITIITNNKSIADSHVASLILMKIHENCSGNQWNNADTNPH